MMILSALLLALVNIISTVELHLDGDVINAILILAQFSDFIEKSHWILLANDVGTQSEISVTNAPDMEIMEVNILFLIKVDDSLLQILNFDSVWSTFHKNEDAVAHDWENCDAHNN